jgi:sugar/nucleoside kinase (ribokinase family)
MVDFVTFGVIVDDIVFPDGQTRMGVLGGGGPQTAWGMAAALGSGARVGLAAGVGDDLDADTLDPLRAAGINLDGVRVTDQPTPRAWQVMEYDGRRTQVFRVPGPSLGMQLARRWDVLPESYRAARWFHWGIHPGEDGSLAFARDLIGKGRRVSLEPFKPPDQPLDDDTIRAMLSACTVFSPNWIEAVRLVQSDDYATILERLHALGAHTLAIRRGAEGGDVWDRDAGRGVHVPAVQTTAVDVVGAGNAFCGALVARLDEGIASAACHATAAASYMIEQVGMPAALPDAAEYARRVDEVRAGLRALKR